MKERIQCIYYVCLIATLISCKDTINVSMKASGLADQTKTVSYSQTFLPAISSTFDRTNASGLSSSDLDYDGKTDLIIRYSNKMIIYWGGSSIADSTIINIPNCNYYSARSYGENQTHFYCGGVVNTHYMIKNNGDRSFSTETNIEFGVTYPSFTDLNNDGLIDLYHYNPTTDTLRFAKNLGNGVFSPVNSLNIGAGVEQMHDPVDVNNDGLLDFVFARAGSVEFVFLAGDFSNYTTSQLTYSVNFGANTSSLKRFGLGDFNLDGRMDFAALSVVDKSLNIHLQQPNGSFVETNIDTSNSGGISESTSLFILDANDDGIDDIIHIDDSVWINPTLYASTTTILGNTNGVFSENIEVLKPWSEYFGFSNSSQYSIRIEGSKKLLGMHGTSSAGFYFTFNLNGDLTNLYNFAPVITNQTVSGGSTSWVWPSDKNQDGFIEGVIVHANNTSTAYQSFASLSNGDGTWTTHQMTTASCTSWVGVAGISTNSFYTFYCTNSTNNRYEFYNMSAADGSTFSRFDITNTASSSWGAQLADMDEDKKNDFFMHDETNSEWSVYWAKSERGAVGSDSTIINLESSSSPVIGRAILDFNGDGLLDFVATHDSGEIFLYLHKPK